MSELLDPEPLLWHRAEIRFSGRSEEVRHPDLALTGMLRLIEKMPVVRIDFTMLTDGANVRLELGLGVKKSDEQSLQVIQRALIGAEGDAGFTAEASVDHVFDMAEWKLARVDLDRPTLPSGERFALPLLLADLIPHLAIEARIANMPFGYRARFYPSLGSIKLARALIPALSAAQTRFARVAVLTDCLRDALELASRRGWFADEALCIRSDAGDAQVQLIEQTLSRWVCQAYPFLRTENCHVEWSQATEVVPPHELLHLEHVRALRPPGYCTDAIATALKHARDYSSGTPNDSSSNEQPRGPVAPHSPTQGPFAFFSYAHRDAEVARQLVECMRAAGVEVWFDANIETGTAWDDTLEARIREATIFVACLTQDYEASRFCRRELKFADFLRKPIIPIAPKSHDWGWGLQLRFHELQILKIENTSGLSVVGSTVQAAILSQQNGSMV